LFNQLGGTRLCKQKEGDKNVLKHPFYYLEYQNTAKRLALPLGRIFLGRFDNWRLLNVGRQWNLAKIMKIVINN